MDTARISEALKKGLDDWPRQLQLAARWVIDHPADVALLTTREQARRADLSAATLVRLAQRLGFAGYDELRLVYAAALRGQPEDYSGRAAELVAKRERGAAGTSLSRDLLQIQQLHLGTLSMDEMVSAIETTADEIAAARQVFSFGIRSGFLTAYLLDYLHSLIGKRSVLVDMAGARGIDMLRDLGPGDMLLVTTVRPYSRQVHDVAEFGKKAGARVVVITDSPQAPVMKIADASLIVPTRTPSFFHSMIPALAIVECLGAEVALRMGADAVANLKAAEQRLASFSTYLPRNAPRSPRQ